MRALENFAITGVPLREFSDLVEALAAVKEAAALANADLGLLARQTADLFIATTKGGLADGFIEAHSNKSGKNTLVAGFQAADGNSAMETLKLLPQARLCQR